MSLETSGAIPAGSTVLVTGANGFLGSHIAKALLAAGYRVRGTARSAEKMAAVKKLFDDEFGAGRFEVDVVEDLAAPGAYDEACKGVSGIAHVASVLTFSRKPEEVIDPVIAGTLSILRSAAASPSVKRFVLTSSSCAGTMPKTNVEGIKLDESSWNEESSVLARELDLDNPGKPWHVYGASKAEGERAAWKFMAEEKPSFVLNTVLPNCNFGQVLESSQPASTAGWIKALWANNVARLAATPPQWFVNPKDTGLLHLAALTFPAVTNARIWAVAETFNWTQVQDIFRKIAPEREFTDLGELGQDLSEIDNSRGTEILLSLGRPGWRGLDESVRENVAGLE